MTGPTLTSRLIRIAGIDFHVLATLLSRGWSVVAGALTVLLVPLFLSPTEQGYYYTFASLLGLQILFELGLGQVIIQLVGHHAAHLEIIGDDRLAGEEYHIDLLASLTRWLRRWYRVAALAFALLAGGAGGLFLTLKGQLSVEHWTPVWVVLVLSSAVNLTYVPLLALQEGLGRIGQVARLRLAQSVVGYAALWLALFGQLSLWAACMVPLATSLLTAYWLNRIAPLHRWLCARPPTTESGLDWRRDVFPFQWRIALSAISGYFIFYAFTPLVFANRGAVEAGRFGIAMAVFNALSAVGTSWVYARAPAFAMHIARGERAQLNSLFLAVLRRSVIFTTVVAASVVLTVVFLDQLGVQQMKRIADPAVLTCLAAACAVNAVIFSVAAYMRAHREEPMLPVSIVGAVLTALIAYVGSKYSVLAMSLLYALLTACV
ncbi:MAG: hypothetical protein QG612_99, partial [Pseudomonadota bacterium]|nr:hypothetical protein [Pseudomonadota bacterium]